MAKLIYLAIASLDGYIADRSGSFGWAAPDDDVHAHVNSAIASTGTYLYGRRMYEVMAAWETMELADESAVTREFAQLWRAADKIVYSTTLERVHTDRTRLERGFDAEVVRQLKADADRDIGIGGPGLAAHAISAGLVDDYLLYLVPHLVGGGTRALPDGVRAELELVDEQRFAGGTVYLRYRPITAAASALGDSVAAA